MGFTFVFTFSMSLIRLGLAPDGISSSSIISCSNSPSAAKWDSAKWPLSASSWSVRSAFPEMVAISLSSFFYKHTKISHFWYFVTFVKPISSFFRFEHLHFEFERPHKAIFLPIAFIRIILAYWTLGVIYAFNCTVIKKIRKKRAPRSLFIFMELMSVRMRSIVPKLVHWFTRHWIAFNLERFFQPFFS